MSVNNVVTKDATRVWVFIYSFLAVLSKAATRGVPKNSQNSQENTCARVSCLIKLQASGNFLKKETLAQVFSCEFCDISKNTFFAEHLRVTASVLYILWEKKSIFQ